ncbi:hypothetical protein RJT34_31286 [Clitoria ternatea]|uniref:Uncharacterized protein n=1 Tax=Clitoria ternatea TaxID=43366 RepID=A0AAN9I2S1_CLITE
MADEFCECRPLGFVTGLPFALVSLVLAPVGAVIWLIGSILSCLSPSCMFFTELTDVGVSFMKLSIRVHKWFIRQIPC